MAKIKEYVFLLIETRKDPSKIEVPHQYFHGVYATKEKAQRMKEHLSGEMHSTWKIKEEPVIE